MHLPHSADYSVAIQGRSKTVVIHYRVVPYLSARYYCQRILFYFHLFSGRRLKKTIALLNILSQVEALISKDWLSIPRGKIFGWAETLIQCKHWELLITIFYWQQFWDSDNWPFNKGWPLNRGMTVFQKHVSSSLNSQTRENEWNMYLFHVLIWLFFCSVFFFAICHWPVITGFDCTSLDI